MSQATVRNFQEKQVIFYEGEMEKSLYKIISGKVGFYVNYGMPNETVLGISAAPNYFGALNCFSDESAVYTAVAMERSMVLQLPERELETFAKSDPTNALAMMKTLAGALCKTNEQLRSLLNELREAVRADNVDREDLAALLERCGAAAERNLIVDPFSPYRAPEPVPVQQSVPAPAQPAAQQPVQQSVVSAPVVHSAMPEPYLEGHKAYPGIQHPEYSKYLIPQEYTCPHCQKKFQGKRIQVSKLIPQRSDREEKRYDLRVTYGDFEMEWHEVITCPYCYFSSFDNFFKDSKSLYRSRYEGKLAQLCDHVGMDFAAEKDLDMVFAQHYLALACAPGFTDWRQINARIWLNLVRLYQDAGEPELAEIAEKNALDAYQTVYMEVELTEGQEQRLCLTMAGILYARGEKRAAREWATKVRGGSGDRSAYWNMAEQLIQDVRAEMAAENM